MRDAWGMNAVRFLVLWAGVEPSYGQYDDAYIEGIAQRIEWARDANLLVVLDMHQDVYGEGFSNGGGPELDTFPVAIKGVPQTWNINRFYRIASDVQSAENVAHEYAQRPANWPRGRHWRTGAPCAAERS